MNLLEVNNLQVSYSNHTAIEKVSFKVAEGEYICLVGENGSGKSTLISCASSVFYQMPMTEY